MTPRERAAFTAGIEAARQMALTTAITIEAAADALLRIVVTGDLERSATANSKSAKGSISSCLTKLEPIEKPNVPQSSRGDLFKI